MRNSASFHSYSIWLFTVSDLKTIVAPSLVFGIGNALAVASYDLKTPFDRPDRDIIGRTPLVALWIWINLLPFNINNQTAAGAVAEDKINKPWRTVPAGRMTIPQARRLMLWSYCLAVLISVFAGGVRQSVGLIILGTWYNNFGGGDKSCLIRNIINGCGYVCFTSGAMEVALGLPLPLETSLLRWFGIIAAIIFSTVHLQDMYDQAGDRVKGRNTVPLVIGDGHARWIIAVAMPFWGSVCPLYFNAGFSVTLSSLVLWSTELQIQGKATVLRVLFDQPSDDPSPTLNPANNVGVTELVLYHFPSPLTTKDSIMHSIDKMRPTVARSESLAVYDGWSMDGKADDRGATCSIYVNMVGWVDVDAHMRFQASDDFKQNVHHIMGIEELGQVDLHHVEFSSV
ncbi:MAG: hypothetical protein Q9168_003889 [Polycauliona sp. 1 TL-2023]